MLKKSERKKKGKISVKYLEPIPIDSFIRHQLLRLFIKNGLDDFQAQILLSIVLHGGQIKPKTLAKDIQCNPTRLELPDGFPSLLKLNLITMSHTRPKTVILAIGIDELLERLLARTLKPNNFLQIKDVLEVLNRLDQYNFTDGYDHPGEIDSYTYLLNYYNKLISLVSKFPSLPSLMFLTFSSLWMNPSEAIVLTKLIICGGKISKKAFFLKYIKNMDPEILFENSRFIEDDLKLLGFTSTLLREMVENSNSFYKQKDLQFKFSSEQQLNTTLNCLSDICQSTSMGGKEGKRKFKNLTLIKTLSQIADSSYRSVIDFKKKNELEIQTLRLAYSNVKLVDGNIFLSSIADPSSTRKRLETDIKYAENIYLVLIHNNFVEDIFLKVFDSENVNFDLNLIIAEEEKELFIGMLKKHKSRIQGKRGISTSDTVTLVPSDEIPQDILIGNTILLFYEVGSSMIIIHEEITKENPTEINTISNDVELALKSLKELRKKNLAKNSTIISLINKGGK